jgi:synaptic vesicle membrane protein VAT-1
MKKLLLTHSGNKAKWKIGESKIKSPEKGEVSVDIHFSGINFADIMIRLGLYPDAPKTPFVPGYEFSGVITQIGAEVEGLKVGDRVFGGCCFGGYCDQITLASWQVRPLPEKLSLREGAALPVSFITAYCTWFEMVRIRNGDRVFLDCASGALGAMSIELLKAGQIEVVGLTSSPEKKKLIEERGAMALTHQEFFEQREKWRGQFQAGLNSLGGASIKQHYQCLAPSGRLVCIGASAFFEGGKLRIFKVLKELLQMPKWKTVSLMNDNRGVFGLNVLKLFENIEYLNHILDQAALFDIAPVVDCEFRPEDIEKAHGHIEQKKARGKVLIRWREEGIK